LELVASGNINVQLPFSATAQQLRHLLIAGGRLPQAAVRFEAAAQLTSLEIAGVTADRQLLQCLALLTSLECLTLHNIDSGPLIGMQQLSLQGPTGLEEQQIAWCLARATAAAACTAIIAPLVVLACPAVFLCF
jgi:hypothetical protein